MNDLTFGQRQPSNGGFHMYVNHKRFRQGRWYVQTPALRLPRSIMLRGGDCAASMKLTLSFDGASVDEKIARTRDNLIAGMNTTSTKP